MDKVSKNASLKSKNRFRFFMSFVCVLLFIAGVFFVLSGICFGILDILIRLQRLNIKFHYDWQQYLTDPKYVFVLYHQWWDILIKSLRHISLHKVLFFPFIALCGTMTVAFAVIMRQEYAVRLWYIINFHFAKSKDIKRMELNKNNFAVLGKFSGMVLGTKQNESVLCIGEMGSGKTSSVSIPTVLRSDNASILAVDLTGKLPQYTAGYRAKLGEVSYFNWDSLDDPKNNIYYPRWNPFTAPHLPKKSEDIDAYVKRIAAYFVDIDDNKQNNYWNLVVHEFITTILNYFIIKTEQAKANDYFLEKMTSGGVLTKEDKDLLLSYYIQMPKKLAAEVIDKLNDDMLNTESYLPIGSWAGILEQWQGREVCFASIADWLIYNYENSADNGGKDWYNWIKSLLNESLVFAYGVHIIESFNRILMLSAKQRSLVLAQVVKPFVIFTIPSLRERTNGNDIDFANIRGMYDEEDGKIKPSTIYSLANTSYSKVINQIFIDEMLYYIMNTENKEDDCPVLAVLDDVGHNLRLRNLARFLETGEQNKTSALLLCNSLSLVANTYSKEELETMIIYTDYKIIKASDNRHLGQQMDKLASFSTRSVEIPRRKVKTNGKPYADANCFHNLAKDFKLCDDIKINTRECQIVLVRGFYNRPIIADNVFFEKDKIFGKLAAYPANYTLPLQKVLQKTEHDLSTPSSEYLWDGKGDITDDICNMESGTSNNEAENDVSDN